MAGRKCTICTHPAINEINKMLLDDNVSLNGITLKYNGISEMALSRHRQNHLPKKMLQAYQAKQAAQGDDLLSQIKALKEKAWSLLAQAESGGDIRVAITGLREVRASLELLAKATGELPPEKVLLQYEPIISSITLILRQEIRDSDALERISQRLLQEASSGGEIIDV